MWQHIQNYKYNLAPYWTLFKIKYKCNTKYRPGCGQTICPARRWQFDTKIAADLRPSADGSAVRTGWWWPAVAELQATSVPIAQAAAPWDWDRQTDGSRYGIIRLN